MRNLFMIMKNGIRRSTFLIPGVLFMVAILSAAYMGGRAAAESYAVDSVSVGVIDMDNSMISADMLAYMEEELAMKVELLSGDCSYEESMDKMTGKLLDAKIALILEIPAGMQEELLAGRTPELPMTVLGDYANEAYMKSYINSYMERTALLTQAAGQDEKKLEKLLEEASGGKLTITLQDGAAQDMKKLMDENGVALMMGFFTFVGFGYPMFMGMLIQEDKKNGTFKRVQVSSVKPAVYIGGMAAGNFLIALLVVLGILVMLAVTGTETNTPYWLLVLLMILYVVHSIGINLLAAFLSRSGFTFMTIGVCYVAIGNILGGAYFPLGENILAKLSVLTPQYYMMNTVRGLAEDASYRYGTNLCILFLMLLLVFLCAAVVYARREN